MITAFTADVQYNHFTGTSAADNADFTSIEKYLREKELVGSDEFLLGFQLWIGENHNGKLEKPQISAFVYEGGGKFDTMSKRINELNPVPARRVKIDMALEEFLLLFKRFDVVMTTPGLNISGRDLDLKDE